MHQVTLCFAILFYFAGGQEAPSSLDSPMNDRLIDQNIRLRLQELNPFGASFIQEGPSLLPQRNEGPAEKPKVPHFGRVFLRDLNHIARAPFKWEKSDWTRFGLWSLSVPLLSGIDNEAARFINEHKTPVSGSLGNEIGKFGQEYSFVLLAGFYLSEKIGGHQKGGKIARDGLISSLIAGGILSPLLKSAVGRNRPNQELGSYEFQPFSGNHSFPSGHTTQAFALASVVASHYDNIWVKAGSYSLAGLVGVSRMESNAHFSSDVLAGALIGTLVGRKVVRLNEDRRSKYSIEPLISELGVGVSVKRQQGRK